MAVKVLVHISVDTHGRAYWTSSSNTNATILTRNALRLLQDSYLSNEAFLLLEKNVSLQLNP